MSAPYSLAWGAEIYSRVSASNIKGMSVYSATSIGTPILTYPDSPFNLANDSTQSSGSTIGLVWNEGAENGGTAIIDYQVSYDQGLGTDTYSILASGITDVKYSVMVGVTSGSTYKFKVKARNSFGLSDYSASVSILAA
jgi:hypothetical protein